MGVGDACRWVAAVVVDDIVDDADASNGSGGTSLLKMVVVDSCGGCSGSDEGVCGRLLVLLVDDSGSVVDVGGRGKPC